MKNIIIIASAFPALGLLLTTNPTFVSGRVRVCEMAESGISLEFPVAAPDKAVPDALTEKIISEDLKI